MDATDGWLARQYVVRREQDSGTQGTDVGFDAGSPLVQGQKAQEAGVAANGATKMLLLV